MKKIYLSKNKYALVDDEDFNRVSHLSWYASKSRNVFYAKHTPYKMVPINMHRLIMNPPKGVQIDHINGNGLDNRRKNLRFATNGQNMANRKINKNNKTGFKGVSISKTSIKKPFIAQIKHNKKVYYLGCFKSALTAHRAYLRAAREKHGVFTRGK